MTLEVIGFWVLAVLLVGSALAVVLTKNLFHSVLWLALALTGTAGVFLMLDAEFLAGVQVLLYAGGVVLNDVFDADLDAVERPERPIPSALISKKSAGIFGAVLLLFGIVAAGFVHQSFFNISLLLAVAIAAASVRSTSGGRATPSASRSRPAGGCRGRRG